jgi:hypothetical protein
MVGLWDYAKLLNKWMIAFFVMAIVFEFTREILVIELDSMPTPNTNGIVSISGSGDYVSANGEWTRINAGEPMDRLPTAIECRKRLGVCIESNVNLFPETVMAPNISIHEANFAEDAITWTDDFPWCVRYEVRIDLKSEKIFSERHKKSLTNEDRAETPEIDKICSTAENFVAMELKKSSYKNSETENEHFVPFLSLLKIIFS